MLGRLLTPLDRRQQMLLLSMLSFGGSSAQHLLDYLPDDEARLLVGKAQMLEQIPKEKRVPLMVREIRQLLTARSVKGLEGVEPSWLIAGLRGESPRTIAIVLLHMPSSLSKQVIARLPAEVRDAMPSREDLRTIPLEVVKMVRARFDAKFAAMPMEGDATELHFRHIVSLSAKDLVTLVRHLGADEIACAFVAAGKRAFAEFLRRLPATEQEELIAAVRRVSREDGMELKAAQAFMGKVLDTFSSTDELLQKAGLYRLARTIVLENNLFIRQMSQRFPRAHGRLLGDYLNRVRERGIPENSQLARLRNQVVDEIIDLARRGKVDSRYSQSNPIHE